MYNYYYYTLQLDLFIYCQFALQYFYFFSPWNQERPSIILRILHRRILTVLKVWLCKNFFWFQNALKTLDCGGKRKQMTNELFKANVKRAGKLLKAMSNEHRLLILQNLLESEKCVGDLEQIVGLSQSALSQHLARLRRDDLVKTRRVAQTIYYSLAGDEVSSVIETLYQLYCQPSVSLAYASEDGKSTATY